MTTARDFYAAYVNDMRKEHNSMSGSQQMFTTLMKYRVKGKSWEDSHSLQVHFH